jgi:hypothetical protein
VGVTDKEEEMGQYHLVVNLDRKEFIHPHRFGDGLKLLEFGCSADGTLTGLAILLACSNGRGGGDLHLAEWSNPGGRRAAPSSGSAPARSSEPPPW